MSLREQLQEEAKNLALKHYELKLGESQIQADIVKVEQRLKELQIAFSTLNSYDQEVVKDGAV